MVDVDRRNALRRILWGAAIVAGGAVVMPNGADAIAFVDGGGVEPLEGENLYTRAQVVVAPARRRRRRWVCWWHRGRRICGWR